MEISNELYVKLLDFKKTIDENVQSNIENFKIGLNKDIGSNAVFALVFEKDPWKLINWPSNGDDEENFKIIRRLSKAPFSTYLFVRIIRKIECSDNVYKYLVSNGARFGFGKNAVDEMLLYFNHVDTEPSSDCIYNPADTWLNNLLQFSYIIGKMKQPTKTIIEQAIEPIIWTGTKEQLAAAINVFVQNGCIANENHWKIFSDHFVVKKKATNEPERLNPKQLSSIFSKTDPSRAKVKKLTDELSEGLKP